MVVQIQQYEAAAIDRMIEMIRMGQCRAAAILKLSLNSHQFRTSFAGTRNMRLANIRQL